MEKGRATRGHQEETIDDGDDSGESSLEYNSSRRGGNERREKPVIERGDAGRSFVWGRR